VCICKYARKKWKREKKIEKEKRRNKNIKNHTNKEKKEGYSYCWMKMMVIFSISKI
jgi:hypothetical protein